MSVIFEANGLTKEYGRFPALTGVTFTLGSGKILGLLGPNGSGKTTLMKLANGLIKPTSGSVRICEHEPGPATKAVVSYLPDRTYFDSWVKIKDCIEFFTDFYADFDRDKAREMLALLGVNENASFRTLSKGTKEKVQLVLVMSRKAQLYLLDEPIGGVDPASRDSIISTIISNYNEEGSVIISTHLISDIERILDEVVLLCQGRVMEIAVADEIREKHGKSVNEYFLEVFANVR